MTSEPTGVQPDVSEDPFRSAERQAMSATQRFMWLHAQLHPGSLAHHLAVDLRVVSDVDVDLLARALADVTGRHELLSANIVDVDGEPELVVRIDRPPAIQIVDGEHWAEAEVEQFIDTFVTQPFDLRHDHLARWAIIRRDDGDHRLLMSVHHAVADLWSIVTLVADVGDTYDLLGGAAEPRRATRTLRFADVVERERARLGSAEARTAVDEWRRRLHRVEPLRLPTDQPRRATAHRGALVESALGPDLSRRVTVAATALGVDVPTIVLTALDVALHRWTGRRDLPIVTARANRSMRTARTIGPLAGHSVVRTLLDPADTLAELATRVRTDIEAAGSSDIPLQHLIDELRDDLPTSELTDVAFLWQKTSRRIAGPIASGGALGRSGLELRIGSLRFETRTPSFRPALLPLTLLGSDAGGQVQLALEYDVERLERETVEALARRITMAIEALVDDPDRPIGDVSLLSDDEWASLRDEWGSTTAPPADSTIVDRFGECVAEHPDRPAVGDATTSWTYRELDERVERIGRNLLGRGVGTGDTIGILMRRSAESVATVLAVLRCGAAYVPLDPSHPRHRTERMMSDARCSLLVTDGAAATGTIQGVEAVDVAALTGRAESEPDGQRFPAVDPGDLAYVMFTSGSTGTPKGVAVRHRSVVGAIDAHAAMVGLGEGDVVVAQASLTFDTSVTDMFATLLHGAALVVVDRDVATDGLALRDAIASTGATCMDATPTTWRMLIEAGWPGAEGFVAVSGGEVLTPELAAELDRRVGTLWNTYGPTEGTVFATAHRYVTGAVGPVPIGSPITGARVYVLDDHHQPVPDGTIGELYIAGNGVAHGYHHHPELTTHHFLDDPHHPGQRMYRTGDLAHRHTPTTNDTTSTPTYHFHGRHDHQIKLRGNRIELGEIETTLTNHPDITNTAVTTYEHTPGDTRLIAYITTTPDTTPDTTPPTTDTIRTWCRHTLPDHMIPTTVVHLDTLPLTTSNKIDRTRLPPPPTTATTGTRDSHQPPHPGLETDIATIWHDILDTPTIGRHDNFFHLGGHSLLATKIASRVRARLGVQVTVRTIFEHPSVAELADAVRGDLRRVPVLPVIEHHVVGEHHPLTYSQERMWFLHQIEPDGLAYHVTLAARLRGPVDAGAFGRAVDTVVDRHHGLRTVFTLHDGAPSQHIATDGGPKLEVRDLTGHADDVRWNHALEALGRDARRPFRIDQLPLARAVLYRLADDDHALLVSMHHIIADEWAFGMVMAELAECYRAELDRRPPVLSDIDISPVDYAAWHRALIDDHLLDDQLAYWTDQLASVSAVELPTDRPRPLTVSSEGAMVTAAFPDGLRERLDRYCRDRQVSPYMVMLAAYQLLLGRLAATDDVPVGTALANRNWLESEGLMASLVNTLVLRTDLAGDPTFDELVGRAERVTLDAFSNQDVPFARVVAELSSSGHRERPALYRAFFNVLHAPFGIPDIDGVDVEIIPIDRGATQLDLSLAISTAADLAIVEFDTDLFDHSTIERFIDRFWRVLDIGVAEPHRRTATIPLLGDDEWTSLRSEWAATTTEPTDPVPVHQQILAAAERDPDAVALSVDDDTTTYRELAARTALVQRALLDAGVQSGQRVGLLVHPSADMVAGLLAVHGAGVAFVPLDPDLPPERLAHMADDAGCELLLTDAEPPDALAALERLDLRDLRDLPEVTVAPGASPADAPTSRPDDLAYVIYTSGSTGRPKGVSIAQRHLTHFVDGARERIAMGPDDVVVSLTTLSFDPSLMELLLPLTVGARVEIVPRTVAVDGRALAARLDRCGATFVQATPTTYRMLLESGWTGAPTLTLVCGGEIMTPDLAAELRGRSSTLWNAYGPTETTVWTTFERVGGAGASVGPVPIGSPITGARVYVLDDHHQPVPDGTIGELYIAGNGVAHGYHHHPELTTHHFLDDPHHPGQRMYRTGDLAHRHTPTTNDTTSTPTYHFHGRHDHQIKLRGNRIELGEIETTLTNHPDITNTAVTTYEHTPGDTRLIAYITTTPDTTPDTTPPTTDTIRTWCRHTLPDHMIPTTVVHLDTLPLTTSNKIDRTRLPPPPTTATTGTRDSHQPPHPGLETDIATIWHDILDTPTIGRHDNFFHLGGHSLLAIRMFAEIERRLGRSAPIASLFEAPTLAAFSALIEASWQSDWTSLVPVQPHGARAPFFYVAPYLITALSFANLGEAIGTDQPLYVLQPQGLDSDHRFHRSIEEMASHYLAEIRDVQPVGPFAFGGHCSGSAVAFEMARQVQAAGEHVAALVLVDGAPPGAAGPLRRPQRPVQRLLHYFRDGCLLPALAWTGRVAFEMGPVRWFGRGTARRRARLRVEHARAHAAYQGGRATGNATLIRSLEWATQPDNDWQLGWRDLLDGSITETIVPGTHARLVEVGYSSELAERIRWALDGIDAPAHATTDRESNPAAVSDPPTSRDRGDARR